MTDPNELFPEDSADLKPWHPLMGFGWDAVRRVEAHHFSGIIDAKLMNWPTSRVATAEHRAEEDRRNREMTEKVLELTRSQPAVTKP